MKSRLMSPSKLKIQLDRQDLDRYGLTFDQLSYSKPYARTVLKETYERAKRETGFCPDGCRLFIEAFPESGGGCSLVVTKLPLITDGDLLYRLMNDSRPAGEADASVAHYIFRFQSFDDLLDSAKELSAVWRRGFESFVARMDGAFYMGVALPHDASGRSGIYATLSEFAQECREPQIFAAYLSEHGQTCITHSAVERLGGRRTASR